MKCLAVLASLALAMCIAAPAGASTPAQQLKAQKAKVAKLTRQLATSKKTIKGLKAQVATINGLDATIAGLTADKAGLNAQVTNLTTQVTTLTAQVTQQAQGGLTAVLAGNPGDWWNAIVALWQVFPNQTTTLCGYQKNDYLFVSSSFTHTEYDFSSYTNCAP